MYISVIADSDTVAGFRLAGITNVHDTAHEDADLMIRELSNDEGAAIIIVTEGVAEGIRATIEDIESRKRVTPIIIEIPDKSGKLERPDPIRELIKRAIGVEMR
jgi:V/A-type H+-transporting ATPase subunit F